MEEQKPRSPRAGGAVPTQPRGIEQIIKAAVDRGASDLHIKAGDVFRARIDGKLVPLTKQRLTPEQTRAIALRLLPSDEERARIDRVRDYDCSWGAPGIGRFRVNILRQRSSFMIVLRVIPFDVPSFESLKLPPVLTTVAAAERGVILVTGVTGSGKSSTMAAIINHINQTQNKHIATLENPSEFLHRHQLLGDATRDRRGHGRLPHGSPGRPAPGPGRRADRRDAGRRNDRHRHEGGGDGPSRGLDPAHAGRGDHGEPRRGDVSARGAGDRPRASLRGAAGRGLPAPAPSRRWARPRGCRGGPDLHGDGARHDQRPESRRRAPRLHPRRAGAVRHPDLRPAPHGAGGGGGRRLRHRAGGRLEPRRLRAADADAAPALAGRPACGGRREAGRLQRRPVEPATALVTEQKLGGVLAPLTTPFDSATGDLAPVHLRRNVASLVEQGIDGFVVAGSTGEAALLDPDEQRRLVAWVREVLPDGGWLVAGTRAQATRAAGRAARGGAPGGAGAGVGGAPRGFAPAPAPPGPPHYYPAGGHAGPAPLPRDN